MGKAKISVLMATYNGEKYIEEQLNSLLVQSREIDELVIVDDYSTDATVCIIRDFIDKHKKNDSWVIYENEKNKGWKKNFHEGISLITGSVLFFCDQDDIWLTDKIECQMKILEQHPEIMVLASEETVWYGGNKPEVTKLSDHATLEKIELGCNAENYMIQCSGCTMAIRREYINRVLPYYIDRCAHDDIFWKIGSLDGKCYFLHESTILHRIHGNNESRKRGRTLKKSIQNCRNEIDTGNQMINYMQTYSVPNYSVKKGTVENVINAYRYRLGLLEKKKVSSILPLATRYSMIFRRKRQLVGDILLAFGLKEQL
ncbi:glycosyltransferase family 2 protein [Clostridium ljungdahlii]|uniref:Putative glycosyltransferase EpsE n=1 Tax=Clostridium ljungdahlii TaxID=1538 RepID=A0A162KU28_9CLOT|nr:glycosyltransferase family 2 protein [Clostridium ljungdahlii]OAA86942.1 putative glycosyltransferase EpsE [Clostridium ljungdahlii]